MRGVETLRTKDSSFFRLSLALLDHGKLKLGQIMDRRHYKPRNVETLR